MKRKKQKNTVINPDFLEFINSLNRYDAKYLLIGGYAVAIHGFPRDTQDIDFFIENSIENIKKVFDAIWDSLRIKMSITPDEFFSSNDFIMMGREPNRIDVLKSISGVKFAEAFKQRIMIDINGIAIQVIGLEHLIANKKSTARNKDLIDADELEKSISPGSARILRA